MRKTLRQRITGAFTGLAIAFAVAVGGSVLAAPAAHAVTYGAWHSCQWFNDNYICIRYVNYNWWEETFLGQRDYTQQKVFMTR